MGPSSRISISDLGKKSHLFGPLPKFSWSKFLVSVEGIVFLNSIANLRWNRIFDMALSLVMPRQKFDSFYT